MGVKYVPAKSNVTVQSSGSDVILPPHNLPHPEAECLDVIGTKVLRVVLHAIHSLLYKRILLPLPPSVKEV